MDKPTPAALNDLAHAMSGVFADCYLEGAARALLHSNVELLRHETELNWDSVGEQHVDRLAKAMCNIHIALNNLRKYADELSPEISTKVVAMMSAYYKLHYATPDHMPNCPDAPK